MQVYTLEKAYTHIPSNYLIRVFLFCQNKKNKKIGKIYNPMQHIFLLGCVWHIVLYYAVLHYFYTDVLYYAVLH